MGRLSTFNFQLSTRTGFTLVELLVVMVVFISVGSIVGSILFSSFRGTNKTNVIAAVSQNGNYALTQIAKMIRGAKSLDGVSVNGTNYVTTCASAEYKYVKITSFDDGQTIFSCSASTIASNGASLLDTSAVSLVTCSFTCSQGSISDLPTIGINFSLNGPSGAIFSEKTASATAIPFQTSVTLRNR